MNGIVVGGGDETLKRMFPSMNKGRSNADQLNHMLLPGARANMRMRIIVETIRDLEDLHVIEQQRGKLRRYGSNTLTALVNRLLLEEVKRERVRQTQR